MEIKNENDGECFICMEPCNELAPCDCKNLYVHRLCLAYWMVSGNKGSCQICGVKLPCIQSVLYPDFPKPLEGIERVVYIYHRGLRYERGRPFKINIHTSFTDLVKEIETITKKIYYDIEFYFKLDIPGFPRKKYKLREPEYWEFFLFSALTYYNNVYKKKSFIKRLFNNDCHINIFCDC